MAFLYNLNSCNTGTHPSKLNMCWNTQIHPYNLKTVFIVGAPLQLYTLVYAGQDTAVCSGTLPTLSIQTEDTCTPSYDIFNYRHCETGVTQSFGFPGARAPLTFKLTGGCDCWTRQQQISEASELITTSFDDFTNCEKCLEDRENSLCLTGERIVNYAVKVKLPVQAPVDRQFSKCCYKNLVLADVSSDDPFKNDYTGTFFKRTAEAKVDFFLINVATSAVYSLDSSTYGIYKNFNSIVSQPDLTYYIVEWKKVLTLLGAGTYQIKKQLEIAGVAIDILSDTYTLEAYSIASSNGTVRLDSIMDGKLIAIDTDFKDSGYKTSLRLRGYFGNPEYTYEQDNIATRDYKFVQNTMSSKKEYKFQALQLPDCITEELFDFMLFGKELFVSDYNGNNHSYKYELTPVKLEGNAGTEYFVTNRGVNVNLTFSDRLEDDRKINC